MRIATPLFALAKMQTSVTAEPGMPRAHRAWMFCASVPVAPSGAGNGRFMKRLAIKADAFIVIFERAKSSPLTRQPDFMHM